MMMKLNPRLRGIKHAAMLLCKGEWQEFLIRLRISLGQVDLRHDPSEAVTERTHSYADSGGIAFDRIMANFTIHPDDAIVDFGCGKGGILITLSKYPFRKITGVEIDPELVAVAKRNIATLKIGNVSIVCSDASAFDQLNEYNYFYFFDPFPCVVMEEVMRNIEKSIAECPRKVTVIYLNPSCRSLMESRLFLVKTGEIPHFEHPCFIYSNSI